MPVYQVQFHPLAIQEFKEARLWYQRRSARTEARFREAVEAGLRSIEKSFDNLPLLQRGYRFAKVRRFPYVLIATKQSNDTLLIVAVQHGSRKPGYWRRRK